MTAPSWVYRLRVEWLGTVPGLPGLSTFYIGNTAAAGTPLTPLRSFFSAFTAVTPSAITWHFDPVVAQIDYHTGTTLSVTSVSTVTDLSGTSSDLFASPVGMLVRWLTAGHTTSTGPRPRTRPVEGKTFMVPVTAVAMNSAGMVNTTWQANAVTAGNALRTAWSNDMWVYTRPIYNKTTGALVRNGAINLVTAVQGAPKAAILSSRRD